VPGALYLFRQDRQILVAAEWVKQNTEKTDVVLFQPNHRWDMLYYPYNAIFSHCTGRPVFVWTRGLPDKYRRAALTEAHLAVVMLPPPAPSGLTGWFKRFRGASQRQPEPTDWLEANGFRQSFQGNGFAAYRKD